MQDEWAIDCLVDGEAEELVLPLFEGAVRGEVLPRKAVGHSPSMEKIPRIRHRSTFGVIEITRGCGRGCQFCSPATKVGRSFPLEHIVESVKVNAREGATEIMISSEDMFLYEQLPNFETNVPALEELFKSIIK